MKKIFNLLVCALLAFAIVGCTESQDEVTTDTELDGDADTDTDTDTDVDTDTDTDVDTDEQDDDVIKATISVDAKDNALTFAAYGESIKLVITTNQEVISVTPGLAWCTIESTDVAGEYNIITTGNTSGAERSTEVIFTAGIEDNTADVVVTIIQEEPSYKVGDVVYNDDQEPVGMIFYVSSDMSQAIAISLESSDCTWASQTEIEFSVDLSSSTYTAAGAAAKTHAVITSREDYSAETFPAFAWAESLGEGWYIPTYGDFSTYLYTAFYSGSFNTTANQALIAIDSSYTYINDGLSSDSSDSTRYWSCSLQDSSNTSKVSVLKHSTKTFVNLSKTSGTPYARAIKYLGF